MTRECQREGGIKIVKKKSTNLNLAFEDPVGLSCPNVSLGRDSKSDVEAVQILPSERGLCLCVLRETECVKVCLSS